MAIVPPATTVVTSITAFNDDRLVVTGIVDAIPLQAQGWVSWTQNFWDEDPAVRRVMTGDEIHDYAVQLLAEVAQGGTVLASTAAEAIVDEETGETLGYEPIPTDELVTQMAEAHAQIPQPIPAPPDESPPPDAPPPAEEQV